MFEENLHWRQTHSHMLLYIHLIYHASLHFNAEMNCIGVCHLSFQSIWYILNCVCNFRNPINILLCFLNYKVHTVISSTIYISCSIYQSIIWVLCFVVFIIVSNRHNSYKHCAKHHATNVIISIQFKVYE